MPTGQPLPITRREMLRLGIFAAAGTHLAHAETSSAPKISLEIAPFTVEPSPKHRYRTLAYNGQVPGPVLRLREGIPAEVEVRNRSSRAEIVHWHGLFLPPTTDGAMEEGTPMIAPGASATYRLTPTPSGCRWYHTHTFAGNDLTVGQFSGLHGFVVIDAATAPAVDREVFLALHDWRAHMVSSDDGSMQPFYECSTINGKMLGFGEPVRVKRGDRILLHLLNSSATDVHWISFSGHRFQVIALDGNNLAQPVTVSMLRLCPAERVSAIVAMDAPGVWVLGEVRRHIQAAGMGVVFEYEGVSGRPQWIQPQALQWSYRQFAAASASPSADATPSDAAIEIPLVFTSRFEGHGAAERWQINGKSFPDTDVPALKLGQRYRLVLDNRTHDDHPLHLHRHSFDVVAIDGSQGLRGLKKDTVLVPAHSTARVEFVANQPGKTLFHCHQQDHMDRGFMMLLNTT